MTGVRIRAFTAATLRTAEPGPRAKATGAQVGGQRPGRCGGAHYGAVAGVTVDGCRLAKAARLSVLMAVHTLSETPAFSTSWP